MPDRQGAPAPGPVLILTPTGRDAEGATKLLAAEGIETVVHPTIESLQAALIDGVGAVLLAEEALFHVDLSVLARQIAARPPWSDLPFIILTQGAPLARRRLAALDLPRTLGNVVFLERPMNALALISAVKSALRARQRQWQVRAYLADQVGAADRVTQLLEARVAERTAALEHAEAERRSIASALAQAQKMEAVGQLTGGLAHDFNNMLMGIIGSLELMDTRLAQGRFEQVVRYVDIARQSANRAASLTHRLLAFSRRQTLDPKSTEVQYLVTGMLELIRSTIGPSIDIEMAETDGLWSTLCDPHQLENALLNLCINARDAMPSGGTLKIELANTRIGAAEAAALREAKSGDYVALCVTDNGCGMPPEVSARAFDPFFTTKPIGQGTGLGLSMIYGFVQQSGGHIQLISNVDQGTIVRLHLPRHEGQEKGAKVSSQLAAPLPAAAHETVLVVDDEPAVLTLVSELLTDLGYEPLVAIDGPSGLQLLRSDIRVDLLITDVGMPGGMNGRQLADAARQERPELKILFITGYAENILSKDGLEPGMQVMTKPFKLDDLATKVRTMMI